MAGEMRTTLLVVFDEEGGLVERLVRSVQLMLKPGSYRCPLQRIVHGDAEGQRRWREFLLTLKMESESLHREEFRAQHPPFADVGLPAIFRRFEDGSLELLVERHVIERCAGVGELEEALRGALGQEAKAPATHR